MGTGKTTARVRAVLLPPRPALRPAAQRPGLALRAEAAPTLDDPATIAPRLRPTADLSGVREPLVASAMAAPPSDDFSAANELPPVALRQESVPKNLIECRVSVVPRLPVVN